MSSVMSPVVAWVCIAVYLGALVFAGSRVYTGITERRTLAEKEFSSLVEFSSTIGNSGFMNEPFRETITDSIAGSKTLQGVIISSPNGEYAFERDQGTIITWIGNAPHFKSQFGISKDPLFRGLRLEASEVPLTVTLSAVYNYIDYDLLITILKRTLLVVLATLCLALFTLVFQSLLVNPSHSPRGDKGRADLSREKDTYNTYKEKEKDDFQEVFEEPLFTQIEKSNPPPKINQPLPVTPVPVPPKETAGLYAPRSHIGREAHTKERIAAELSRCASFGQDMVLMVMELQDTAKLEDARFRLLADEAVKAFLRRDLIFEKGEQGITVVLPSTDLDQGFAKSEKFHKHILATFAETFQASIELYMGLSSRADRLIDAERFILEASGALKKAKDDPAAPIVAFRSDPEKYRAFMAAQNKSRP